MRRETLLFANEQFYLAFNNSDYELMKALWARKSPVICIHPGWPALTDRESILESWQRILAATESPGITHDNAQVFDHGDYACVVCYESVGDNRLVATNAFVEEEGEIRMVLHQAGGCTDAPEPEPQATPFMQ